MSNIAKVSLVTFAGCVLGAADLCHRSCRSTTRVSIVSIAVEPPVFFGLLTTALPLLFRLLVFLGRRLSNGIAAAVVRTCDVIRTFATTMLLLSLLPSFFAAATSLVTFSLRPSLFPLVVVVVVRPVGAAATLFLKVVFGAVAARVCGVLRFGVWRSRVLVL